MTRSFPRAVDVAIIGSGPCGAAYARILSEQAPDATVACFEAGPLLADPPGIHVKNIADIHERATAQRRSEGLPSLVAAASGSSTSTAAGTGSRMVRPGTFLLPKGYKQPGEDGMPGAAMSSNVGGMGAHWTGACPRPGGSERIPFLQNLDGLLEEAERLCMLPTTHLMTHRTRRTCGSGLAMPWMLAGPRTVGSVPCRWP